MRDGSDREGHGRIGHGKLERMHSRCVPGRKSSENMCSWLVYVAKNQYVTDMIDFRLLLSGSRIFPRARGWVSAKTARSFWLFAAGGWRPAPREAPAARA